MSIQQDLDELNSLNIEIARLQGVIKEYRKQKDKIEQRVIDFLKQQETQGVRYNDKAVLLENKQTRNKKKKAERVDALTEALARNGIQRSDRLLQDIFEAQRGKPTTNDVLKIVKRS